MIIKESDGRVEEIKALEDLIASGRIPSSKMKYAKTDLMKIKAGVRGEKEAAYEINRLYGDSPEHIVIHDLRLECKGQVAQIDHIVLNRSFHGMICESKYYTEGLGCNEHGEWVGFYGSKPFGIPSPIFQVRRQTDVLLDLVMDDHEWVPRRFGTHIGTAVKPFVLVSNSARISRPDTPVDGLEDVFKLEALATRAEKLYDSKGSLENFVRKMPLEALYHYGRSLAAHHIPHVPDFEQKYGAEEVSKKVEPPAPALNEESKKKGKKKLICDTCGEKITLAEGRFCWFNKKRFGEGTYCREHQSDF